METFGVLCYKNRKKIIVEVQAKNSIEAIHIASIKVKVKVKRRT